jgi:D-alanyl-D-alanine-carboxypeptidase/D-alanyl-D-alanine-endopeptidase
MGWAQERAGRLAETFDGSFDAPGAAIAVACAGGGDVATEVRPGDVPPDGRFEIGSVTKTMTATLLALLDADGALRLDDEVGRWLSAGVNGQLTLRRLATHTSGLPRQGPNLDLRAADPANPWAGYGFDRAEEGLRQAAAAPGAPWLYSNLGYQLLGLVLERASGLTYHDLLTERLLKPLSMTGGGTLLPGHARGGEVPRWEQPLGAGGVEAAIGDLARYAQAVLHPPPTPLGAAIAATLAPQVRVRDGISQGLGWQLRDDGIRMHGGGTGGFSAAVLVDPGRDHAVALLASHGGYAQFLGRAALLAVAGDDPRQARPRPPGPEWEERAREIVRALHEGRASDVQAATTPRFRAMVSAEQLTRAWQARTRDLGPADEVLVSCGRVSGRVVADVRIMFARGVVALRISFAADQIAGLRFLAPQDDESPLAD